VGLFVFLWLSKRRQRLDDINFRKHFGFLYRTWRQDVCWWEAVSVCQTICLVLIGSFGHVLGVYYQTLVTTAALSIVCILLLLVQPHKSPAAGAVTLFSVWVLMATSYSALTFLPYRNAVPAYGYTMAMGVFVLMINVAFVMSTLWRLLRLLQWGLVRRLLGRCCGSVVPCSCHQLGPCRELRRSTHSMLGALRPSLGSVSAAQLGALAVAPGCCSCKPAPPPVESVKGSEGGHVKPHSRQQHQQQLEDPAGPCEEC
jgi:hypothetical protein